MSDRQVTMLAAEAQVRGVLRGGFTDGRTFWYHDAAGKQAVYVRDCINMRAVEPGCADKCIKGDLL